ncbi:MAG TPA: hypothetical protein VGC67_00920 [Cellulomonas sp.]
MPSTLRRPRGRGERAGLDLGTILEAARRFEPNALTMQSVADVLGVDRKALNYHVSSRENLLDLVAEEIFREEFSAVRIEPDAAWSDACRTYALGFARAVIAAGSLGSRLRITGLSATQLLKPAEALLGKLIAAGADDATALRLLVLLSNTALSHALDASLAAGEGERPRPRFLRQSLREAPGEQFDHLARIAADSIDTYGPEQLEFAISVVVGGAVQLLGASDPARVS